MNFSDLLEALNFGGGEYVSLLTVDRDGNAQSSVVGADHAARVADALCRMSDRNVYFGVNPTRRREEGEKGRGNAADVTRLAALFVDLDVKPGGCDSYETARAIITDLSAMLGTAPSAIVRTGHGLQPYWPIEDGQLGPEQGHVKAAALLRRWRRLVDRVAEAHGAKADNVHELARQLRVPGSFNVKGEPIPVVAEVSPGGPLTVAQIDEVLTDQGIVETEGDLLDRSRDAELVSTPRDWRYSDTPCRYAVEAIKSWRTDVPPKGRHQWMLAQLTRLAAFHRRGCLTEELHREGRRVIELRFTELCEQGIGGDPRPVKHREVDEAVPESVRWAASMTEAHLVSEVGGHMHLRDSDPTAAPAAAGSSGEPVTSANTAGPADMPPGGPSPADTAPQPGGPAAPQDDSSPTVLTPWQMTDAGNADRLVARHADRVRYCPDMGRWLQWDGARWEMHPTNAPAWQAARETVESIRPGDSEALAKWKHQSLSTAKQQAMITQAQNQPALQVRVDDLDGDPYKLNTPDGVVDLRTGELLGPDPGGWHTKVTGVGYAPGQVAPRWSRFLQDTFGEGNVSLTAYMQELAGLAAIGEVREHVLPFLFGSGANGKSVMLDVFAEVLGDYAITAPATFLLAGRAEKHETEIARLRGARLVVCSEINADSTFDEARMKMLTGGDKLTGRFMRQDHFDFRPSHLLMLAGNYQPEVASGGDSFWRRMRLVPFTRTVPADRRVEGLAQQLVEQEGPAILAWIVAGAVRVLAQGLSAPDEVTEATSEYAEQEDALARFLDECCERLGVPAGKDTTGDVAKAYARWAHRNGEPELNAKQFGKQLKARFGIVSSKYRGQRVYRSLRLKDEWRPYSFADHAAQQSPSHVPSERE
ncbi:DNA primase [Mycobacterium phage Malthus]|uniref:DNA primase n=1 Tax=Mycobacterium phage Malthus TaxID=2592661 RepID=A0A5Q2WM51_9CAUD|nr:DNA primase [Mycobacterium phage SamScheppers]QGH80355.1 DNA primase [Mycobacterium phage Malthus]QTF81682.1 DNA primase/helicase [Mycobacterium phage Juliette]